MLMLSYSLRAFPTSISLGFSQAEDSPPCTTDACLLGWLEMLTLPWEPAGFLQHASAQTPQNQYRDCASLPSLCPPEALSRNEDAQEMLSACVQWF